MEKQTPLYKAVSEYIAKDTSRFHMPGHKGLYLRRVTEPVPFSEAYRYDVTEVKGTDSLYEASGAILETEKAFAKIYGASCTLLSAGGATLCVQAMLALVAKEGGTIIAGRSLHISAVNAMALLGLSPIWVQPDGCAGGGIGGRITPESIAEKLKEAPQSCAVYITTPDYFGIMSDIAGIAKICKEYNVPLLVDNSHGAHLKFMSPSLHPMDLGADMCCDSLHKTMPVLTGGALLHIKNEQYIAEAKAKMALFGSTSPSYLIMLSCDTCLNYIDRGEVAQEFEAVQVHVKALEKLALKKGFATITGARDYTKIILSVYNWGLTAEEFSNKLRESGIEAELVSDVWAVLMASPENIGGDYRRVEKFLNAWERPSVGALPQPQPLPLPEQVTKLRDAIFAQCKTVAVADCVGEIAAHMVCKCPPGAPIIMPGEQITSQLAELLKISGKEQIKVVL